MEKIQTFGRWLETRESSLGTMDTQLYDPSQKMLSTHDMGIDPTLNVLNRRRGWFKRSVDPDISQSAAGLKQIHTQLGQIFGKVRVKSNLLPPQMKQAFNRELLAGIDGVGRAHAIILPTAQGG